MKKKTTLLFTITAFFLVITLSAQTPIIGEWINGYNSVLKITNHSSQTGLFTGTYSSSTGATGTYLVSGYSPYTTSSVQSIPISLTINWKNSTSSNSADQEWTSTMSGALMTDAQGQKRIQVFHSLNASPPLAAVQIDTKGRYSETLIFTPNTAAREVVQHTKPIKNTNVKRVANALLGTWLDSNRGDRLKITQVSGSFGEVKGTYTDASGNNIAVTGYTSQSPSSNYQSVSLSFMSRNKRYCFGIGGFLNGRKLEMMVYKAKAVNIANNYSSVAAYKNNFVKTSTSRETNTLAARQSGSVVLEMNKNPYTNNGSAEWTGNIAFGTMPGMTPKLKFSVDTGGNFTWVNSVQCTTNPCVNYGHIQFNQNNSSTFNFIDPTQRIVNWGPWGQAKANLGSDILQFGGGTRLNTKLITQFANTAQFQEFLWDGAIAVPVDSRLTENGVSNLLEELVNNNVVRVNAQGKVCVSFYYDDAANKAYVTFGPNGTPPIANINTASKLVFPQQAYSAVPYLWATNLSSFHVGNRLIANGGSFSFDTGSSALKGDRNGTTAALQHAQAVHQQTGVWPNLTYKMGVNTSGQTGKLVLTPSQYVKYIEQGQAAGTFQPQIQSLDGTTGLYLQGTNLLSSVYTVFWFDAVRNRQNKYDLIGDEVWMYNYTNGPAIIQPNRALRTVEATHSNTVFPNPNNGKFAIQFKLTKNESNLTVRLFDMNNKEVFNKEYGKLVSGTHKINIELAKSNIQKAGIHFLKVYDTNNNVLVEKKVLIK
ncbi:T9SS type A sorting domain-containing protein [Kordia sp.]|uniref:T9SS type A sorting domain-containing protein n=1 Tax=Kordia sp. TaxID=1965332 RepID=UPI003D6C2822